MTSHTALRGTKKRQDLPDQLFPEQNDQGNGDHGRNRSESKYLRSVQRVLVKPDSKCDTCRCGRAGGKDEDRHIYVGLARKEGKNQKQNDRDDQELKRDHKVDATVLQSFKDIRGRKGRACDDHGHGSIHVSYIRNRILQQRMHGNMKKKDTEACERPDNNGREQAFFYLLQGGVPGDERKTVRPGDHIKDYQIYRNEQDAFIPEKTVHQRDADKAAVGIDG